MEEITASSKPPASTSESHEHAGAAVGAAVGDDEDASHSKPSKADLKQQYALALVEQKRRECVVSDGHDAMC
jgi:hypothetical protein